MSLIFQREVNEEIPVGLGENWKKSKHVALLQNDRKFSGKLQPSNVGGQPLELEYCRILMYIL